MSKFLSKAYNLRHNSVAVLFLIFLIFEATYHLWRVLFAPRYQHGTGPVFSYEHAMSINVTEFIFSPTAFERPFKPRVVTTLILSGASKTYIDFYGMAVMFQCFTFLHKPSTRLDPNGNTEFLVVLTYRVPEHYRQILKLMGARLLIIPPLINGFEEGSRYKHMYSKLYLWRLENIYDSILYIDGDIFYFDKTPTDFFKVFDEQEAKRPGAYFFGAAKDWAKDWPAFGPINAGMMLFKPSLYHFQNLLNLAGRKEYKEYFEQQLIGKYFTEDNPHLYTPLNPFYNVMHFGERTSEELNQTIGYHQKFWNRETEVNGLVVKFTEWALVMQQLRRLQLDIYRNPNIDERKIPPRLPVVPVVPENYMIWDQVKVASTMFETIAILSSSMTHKRVLQSRENYAERYSQAYHTVFHASVLPNHPHSPAANNFLKVLQSINQLFKTYDWVWYTHEPQLLLEHGTPFHVPLSTLYSTTKKDLILMENECNEEDSVMSFVIHSRLRNFIEAFLGEIRNTPYSNLGEGDSTIWGIFLNFMDGEYEYVERRDVDEFPEWICVNE